MKICVISNLYKPYARGGAEKIAQLTAEFLSKENDVFVISTQPRGESLEEKGKLKIYRFRPLNIFYYLNDYKHNVFVRLIWHLFDVFNFHSATKIKTILKKERPQVVIMHNLKGLGYLIPKVVKKMNLKSILVLHDVQYAVPSGLIIKGKEKSFAVDGFLTKIYQKICKKLIIAEQIISPSKWLLDFYKNKNYFTNSKKNILSNPIASQITGQVDQVEKNNLLFLGQIEEHKGIEFLLEAIKDLKSINLFVAGQGSLLEKLIVKYQNFSHIRFLGKVDRDKLAEVFGQVAYLIVPTLCYENSPTVIYESYSYGRPVIVADIGGTAELIEENKTGYTFEAGNETQMIEKIDLALHNENYFTMSENCLVKVHDYDIKNYMNEVLNLI